MWIFVFYVPGCDSRHTEVRFTFTCCSAAQVRSQSEACLCEGRWKWTFFSSLKMWKTAEDNSPSQTPRPPAVSSQKFFPRQLLTHSCFLLNTKLRSSMKTFKQVLLKSFALMGFWLNYLKLKTNQTPKLPAKQMNNEQRSSCCCSMRLILFFFVVCFLRWH